MSNVTCVTKWMNKSTKLNQTKLNSNNITCAQMKYNETQCYLTTLTTTSSDRQISTER